MSATGCSSKSDKATTSSSSSASSAATSTSSAGSQSASPEAESGGYAKLLIKAEDIGKFPDNNLSESMQRILTRSPDEVFMIEGHTDAVGSEEDNLSLSDRRAESVAVIFSQQFGISPENLVTQGYGKQFLKIPTPGPSRENRRVAVRRITPLLHGQQASR